MNRARALIAASLFAVLAGCATSSGPGDARVGALARTARGFSVASMARVTADMDPAMLIWAELAVPERRPDNWGRAKGWETFSLTTPPDLGLGFVQDQDSARRLNAMLPSGPGSAPPSMPFVLPATGPERERAILCLAQAVYYEAAREPLQGQEAVAQVVINRLRHPAYPKTVCGVVYQGAERITGCQFSFTCDGSVLRAPEPSYFAQARQVAIRALSGYVQKAVGTATFYHADYVFPVWAPTLYKVIQIGAHIFYRFPGPDGQVTALRGAYSGDELGVSMEVRSPTDASAPPPPGLEILDQTQPLSSTAGPDTTALTPAPVQLGPNGRPLPTQAQIDAINAMIASLTNAQAPPTASLSMPAMGPAPAPPPPPPAPAAGRGASAAPTVTPTAPAAAGRAAPAAPAVPAPAPAGR